MNLIFGTIAKDISTSGCDTFFHNVKNIYGETAQRFIRKQIIVGKMGNGRLSGMASDEKSFLLFLGALHLPLPDWKHKRSPLDDPDFTASWLLKRYHSKGLTFLENLPGGFTIALWDNKQERFLLCNDAMGYRQWYYTETEYGFAFSTTLFALNCTTEKNLEIDRSHEDFLLGYEFLPPRRTLYKGVFCLPPGTILEWSGGHYHEHTVPKPDFSHYRLKKYVKLEYSEEKIGNAVYDLFMKCLQEMLPSTKRVAVLLGGFDSALIAVSCKNLGKEVDTYTFRFPNDRFNQAHVDTLASEYGLRHTWVDISPEILRKGLEKFPIFFNQPSSMPHYLIQSMYLFQYMRQEGHYHCFSGDGCDELFLGYPSVYKRAQFFMKLGNIPKPLLNLSKNIFSLQLLEYFFGHPIRFARNIFTIAQRPWPRRGHISNRIFDSVSLAYLRSKRPAISIDTEDLLASFSTRLNHLTPLRLAYHGKTMPGLNKAKLGSGSASAGITILSPFQHPALTELSLSIPENLLRPSNSKSSINGKFLLMHAIERKKVLNRKIIYQKKASPVAGMADSWYMGSLYDFLFSIYGNLPFKWNQQYVKRMLSPKFAEKLFREKLSLGAYIHTAPALLATYASFNKFKDHSEKDQRP